VDLCSCGLTAPVGRLDNGDLDAGFPATPIGCRTMVDAWSCEREEAGIPGESRLVPLEAVARGLFESSRDGS